MMGTILLCDEIEGPFPAPWAGPFLALGARLARRRPVAGARLVVALTVPTRDFAAALIAAGWALTRPVPIPASPAEAARELQEETKVLLIAGSKMIADTYFRSKIVGGRACIQVGGSAYQLDRIEYLVAGPVTHDERKRELPLPVAGSLVTKAGRAAEWRAQQVTYCADVVLIGTKSVLEAEMETRISWGDHELGYNSFDELLRPDDRVRPTWGSTILPAATFEEAVLPEEGRLTVLDGASSIRWISAISSEVTVAIVDRSAPDVFAADLILQLRATGDPLPLHELRWQPLSGVEALAFEARR